jgi:hypothetical protein
MGVALMGVEWPEDPFLTHERTHTMPGQLPDVETLRDLRTQGLSYEQIAAKYGVAQGEVYLKLREDR